MNVSILLSKERAEFLQKYLKGNSIEVSVVNEEGESFYRVDFLVETSLDVMYVFHAGITYGNENLREQFMKNGF